MARFYEKIIGCRNEGIYRVITIFGIKFKRKNARVQTLAEIKKLSTLCANLAGSIKTLTEFSKRNHETTNALLTRGLTELDSQLTSVKEISGRDHRATARKLDGANNLLESLAEMLANFRATQEEVNKLQGHNHHETAQKLDEANSLLKSHTKMLADLGAMQMDISKLQGRNHTEATRKLDEASNFLKSYTEMLAEFRVMQEEANKLQGQNHQATAQKLDEANNLLKSHDEKLVEFRAEQEEVNQLRGRNHQATVQRLDEANNLLKSHTEKLEELGAVQTEVSKHQEENQKETVQKLDEVTKLVKTDVGRTGSLLELEYSSSRYYQNSFEKGFLVPMFEYMNRSDFEERYLELIHGMAPSSIREVNKILSRVSRVKAKPDQARYNFYSVSEQDEKTKLCTDFENQILRISDNLYAYDKYLLPIRHFEICVFLYKHGIELVRDKESVRKKDMIDAGGFIGDSVLVLSDYTDKSIYSFEANPKNFDLLKKTLEINHLSKVIPVQEALWNSETNLEMHVQGSCSSFTEVGGIQYVNGTVKVPTVTLDNFVRENKIDIGLIKVDLEGAELEFLQGAEHTIRTQKPVLLLSIYHKPSDFFELKPLLEQWVPEYEFSVFNPVDRGILLETMIVAQPRLPLSQAS